jgi:hypothetical protein
VKAASAEIVTREHFEKGWVAILMAFGMTIHVSARGATEQEALDALLAKLKGVSD